MYVGVCILVVIGEYMCYSNKTIIGVHEMHCLMYPSVLLAQDPLISLANTIIIHIYRKKLVTWT